MKLKIQKRLAAKIFKGSKKKVEKHLESHEEKASFKKLLTIPGLKSALLVFFCYCTIEATFGLWGASYLVFVRDFDPEDAAKLVSFYYAGITVGRFLAGFISLKLSNQKLVQLGQGVILIGIAVLLLLFEITQLPSFFLIGFLRQFSSPVPDRP